MARGVLAAVLLPLRRLRLLPRCCSAGRRRGESTSAEPGWSHGVRGRREPRTARCCAGWRAPESRGAEAPLLGRMRREGHPKWQALLEESRLPVLSSWQREGPPVLKQSLSVTTVCAPGGGAPRLAGRTRNSGAREKTG